MDREIVTSYERELLDYLRGALPTADQIMLTDEQLLRVIRHANQVREEVPWGKDIPESVFRAFVVFPRVNNEDPVFYHGPLWDAVKERIKGKSMHDAVIEINYWTNEVATYQLTDGRTANALTVIARAYGRCGEESMLLVSVLRAAGIPARQIYVPRWAHCDDNHAWVEAWVDGTWYYLGACEPEPVLNSGWFTAAASKAMLVHTRSYGIDPEGDRVENHVGNAAILNRIEGYAECRLLTVKVTKGVAPAAGLTVRFELANESEFFPISSQVTDENGVVTLLTGYGTLHLHIHDGEKYVTRMVDVKAEDFCEISFDAAVDFVREKVCFDQRPPVETRVQPVEFPEDVAQKHRARLQRCEELRAAWEATFSTENEYFRNARGNHQELRKFFADERYAMEDKTALLDTLREKDFVDFKAETLFDALEYALPYKAKYPFEIWQQGVLCPRVYNEMIYPLRGWLRERMDVEPNARAVWKMLSERTEIVEMEPVTITPDLRAVWESRKASEAVLSVMYVAAARAIGVAARLNPASGEKEFYDGEGWQALLPARRMDAKLVLVNAAGRELLYSTHFTVGRLENGAFQSLEMYGTPLKDRLEIPVLAGKYRVMTCMRQIDGSVDGLLIPVEIAAGETKEVAVEMREDATVQKRLSVELPQLATAERTLPETGCAAILSVLDPGAEPTEHFLNELIDAKGELEAAGLKIKLMIDSADQASNEKLQLVLRELPFAELLTAPELSTLMKWRRLLHSGDVRLPFAVAVDAKGEGKFAYSNYNVGSVRSLMKILIAD